MPSDSFTVDYDAARGVRVVQPVRSLVAHEPSLVLRDADELERRLRDEAAMLGQDGAWLVAWLDYAVVVDAVVPGRPLRAELDPRWLQELRLFRHRGEWRMWRTRDGFAGRRRVDGEGAAGDVLDDDQSLWGTKAEPDGVGGTTVSEARGIRYRLPVDVVEGALPLRLAVRQYLAYGEDGLAGVGDARLVGVASWRGEPIALPGAAEGRSAR